MRLLLISANQEKQYPYPVLPIGAGMVRASLEDAGHKVDFCDICFCEDWRKTIREYIDNNKYDLLLLSLRNIDNCLFPQTKEYITFYKELVKECKAITNMPIVAGGIAMRMMKRLLLDELEIDYGYINQISDDFVNGLEQIVRKGDVFLYNGFIGKSISNINNTVNPRLPDYEMYEKLDIKQYTDKGGVVGFHTKYGCDLNCIYCSYPVIEGREIFCYEPKKLVNIIEKVVKVYHLKFFEFADSTFNYPLSHAKEICKLLAEKQLNVGWSAFISPKFIDEEFIYLCKKSGCTGMDLGIDSASNTMLKNLGKGFSSDDIAAACRIIQKYNIPICFNLLIGGPGENEKTLNETFVFLNDYPNCAVSAYSALRVYPDTPLEKIARQEGQVTGSLLYPQFYISKEIKDNLNEILEEHRKTHPEWMLRGIVKPPSELVIERFNKNRSSPLWTEKNTGYLIRRKNNPVFKLEK